MMGATLRHFHMNLRKAFTVNFLPFFLYKKINYFSVHLQQINEINYISFSVPLQALVCPRGWVEV